MIGFSFGLTTLPPVVLAIIEVIIAIVAIVIAVLTKS